MKDLKKALILPFYLGMMISIVILSMIGGFVVALLTDNEFLTNYSFYTLLLFWTIIHTYFCRIIVKKYLK